MLCMAGLFFLAAGAQGLRPALVVGNGSYRHMDKLSNAVNDAGDIAENLTSLNYKVELLFDGDLAAMTRSIGAWIRRLSAEPSSEGFFWYAGHGVQAAGENYLLPVDIDAENEAGLIYGSYPLGRLLLSLEETARNKLNIVVLDACRDNPFKNLPSSSRGLSRGFVTVERLPQDIFIMFSTAPGTVAADGGDARNSPFTEAFLRYMDGGEIPPVMAGLITRETLRPTGGRQRPYQNGSIVSELYYSLTPPSFYAAPLPAAGVPGPVLTRVPPGQSEGSPDMVLIPAGSFTMGSPASETGRVGYQEEGRRVTLAAFYLGSRELTVAEFRRFAGETGYRTSAEQAGGAFAYDEAGGQWEFRPGADWRRPSFRQTGDHPVVNVSWFDAIRYCNWLSEEEGLSPAYVIAGEENPPDYGDQRLPPAHGGGVGIRRRAGTATPFSTGSRISTAQANYNGNVPYGNDSRGLFRKATVPAASLQPNPWGLYDLHGNVWDWCWDYYGLSDGESAVNPSGPASGVNRGGGWDSPAVNLRAAARSSGLPETAGGSLGFRLARDSAENY
jgi:formylglycine-generating enzyme required for sulfatase activity